MEEKDPELITQKHLHASGNFTDTETTVTHVKGTRTVYVRIRCLPGLQWWSQPPTALVRKWVDEVLVGTNMKRAGKRVHGQGWSYYYYLNPTEQKG